MTDDHTSRSWRDLPADVREQARWLARNGYTHPDGEVAAAALRAVRHDHRLHRLLGFLSLWVGGPAVVGVLLAVHYFGGDVDDTPAWLYVLAGSGTALVAGHQAVKDRGSIPPPLGSGLPLDLSLDQPLDLPSDTPDTGLHGRRLALRVVGVVGGGLAVAYLIVRVLDREPDPLGGLLELALFVAFLAAVLGVVSLVRWIREKWRVRRSGRS
ncbi:MAG TPA: hypothetical protein VF062_14650 [Candidatus Limnocylindrales bacterium]